MRKWDELITIASSLAIATLIKQRRRQRQQRRWQKQQQCQCQHRSFLSSKFRHLIRFVTNRICIKRIYSETEIFRTSTSAPLHAARQSIENTFDSQFRFIVFSLWRFLLLNILLVFHLRETTASGCFARVALQHIRCSSTVVDKNKLNIDGTIFSCSFEQRNIFRYRYHYQMAHMITFIRLRMVAKKIEIHSINRCVRACVCVFILSSSECKKQQKHQNYTQNDGCNNDCVGRYLTHRHHHHRSTSHH